MAKRRRKKRSRSASSSEAASGRPRRTLLLEPEALELARGHDGLLRGQPEPAVIVGAYRVGKDCALVGRVVIRAQPRGTFPVSVPVTSPVLQCHARCELGDHIALLALAVEEDAGVGVTALYAALDDASNLLLYHAHDAVPEPAGLTHLALRSFSAPAALPVEVLFGRAHAREVGSGDDFVGGAVLVTPSELRSDTWRFAFADPAGQNDWVLVARMRIR